MGLWGSGSLYLAAACLLCSVSVSLFLAPGLGAVLRLARLRPELGTIGTPGIGFACVPMFGTFSGIRL